MNGHFSIRDADVPTEFAARHFRVFPLSRATLPGNDLHNYCVPCSETHKIHRYGSLRKYYLSLRPRPQSTPRTTKVVMTVVDVTALLMTVTAAACLGGELRKVHDICNLSSNAQKVVALLLSVIGKCTFCASHNHLSLVALALTLIKMAKPGTLLSTLTAPCLCR